MLAAGGVSCLLLLLARSYVAVAAGMLLTFGADAALRLYITKTEYLALLGGVTLAALCIFGALSLLLKCFAVEDVAIMKKAARAIGIPPWGGLRPGIKIRSYAVLFL